MKALIKKDLFMIKNNYKSFLIALIIYVFYAMEFKTNLVFFLPFMGLMSCISTLSYDDYNNFHTYAISFPKGKLGIVKSKYITVILVVLILSILGLLADFIVGNIIGNYEFMTSFEEIYVIFFVMLLMAAIMYPLLFKYGTEKGRIVLLLTGFIIAGLGILLSKGLPLGKPNGIIIFIDKYFSYIASIVTIILLTVSYFISKKIYLKKEF